MKNIFLAITTLTTLRLPIFENVNPGKSVRYFPVAGILIAVFFWLILFVFAELSVAAAVTAFVLVVFYVFITGALHLDGLADWADAHFAGKDRIRTLEILKDKTLGVFGSSALVLNLAGKWILYKELILMEKPEGILLGLVISRLAGSFTCSVYPSVRKNGTATAFIDLSSYKDFLIAFFIGNLAAFLYMNQVGIYWVGVSFLFIIPLSYWLYKRIQGVTGDLIGASIELAELLFLLVFTCIQGI